MRLVSPIAPILRDRIQQFLELICGWKISRQGLTQHCIATANRDLIQLLQPSLCIGKQWRVGLNSKQRMLIVRVRIEARCA
ncbi:MAG TPA: hypothetical protein VFW23_06000, partial [Tepidisphaeraceae bacterium]|nr:hypothetical protein [Tepidisphaeraceae bacterium]